MEATSTVRRPRRLWVATILNMLIGLLAVGFLTFLLTSARVPAEVRPGIFTVASGGILACLLVIYSSLALAGRFHANRVLLLVATLYFGSIIIQNALPLLGLSDSVLPARKLTANVVRNAISLGINWWALTSGVTLAFFASRSLSPDTSLERTRETR